MWVCVLTGAGRVDVDHAGRHWNDNLNVLYLPAQEDGEKDGQ